MMYLWLIMWALASSTAHATRYAFDDSSGSITFDMAATLHAFSGTAQSFSGELEIGGDSPTGQITVQSSALTTHLSPRDERMRDLCLSTAQFPTIVFAITAIDGDTRGLKARRGSGSVILHGQLTIRSTTRDVSIPAAYRWQGGALHLSGSHQLNWTDFDVPDPSILISTLQPEMGVQFDVTLSARP